jgi:hypothetical protein
VRRTAANATSAATAPAMMPPAAAATGVNSGAPAAIAIKPLMSPAPTPVTVVAWCRIRWMTSHPSMPPAAPTRPFSRIAGVAASTASSAHTSQPSHARHSATTAVTERPKGMSASLRREPRLTRSTARAAAPAATFAASDPPWSIGETPMNPSTPIRVNDTMAAGANTSALHTSANTRLETGCAPAARTAIVAMNAAIAPSTATGR